MEAAQRLRSGLCSSRKLLPPLTPTERFDFRHEVATNPVLAPWREQIERLFQDDVVRGLEYQTERLDRDLASAELDNENLRERIEAFQHTLEASSTTATDLAERLKEAAGS